MAKPGPSSPAPAATATAKYMGIPLTEADKSKEMIQFLEQVKQTNPSKRSIDPTSFCFMLFLKSFV